jgi:hypothetical protein
MIPKSMPSDLVRGWDRFSDKIMLKKNVEEYLGRA